METFGAIFDMYATQFSQTKDEVSPIRRHSENLKRKHDFHEKCISQRMAASLPCTTFTVLHSPP